jgi:hypothetical protein
MGRSNAHWHLLTRCRCWRCLCPHCSYGFVVYEDPNVVDIACAGLNGLTMGDRTLTVRRAAEVRAGRVGGQARLQGTLGGICHACTTGPAVADTPPHTTPTHPTPHNTHQNPHGTKGIQALPTVEVPLPGALMQGLGMPGVAPGLAASRILVLKNAVELAELSSDTDYEEICQDMEVRCGWCVACWRGLPAFTGLALAAAAPPDPSSPLARALPPCPPPRPPPPTQTQHAHDRRTRPAATAR